MRWSAGILCAALYGCPSATVEDAGAADAAPARDGGVVAADGAAPLDAAPGLDAVEGVDATEVVDGGGPGPDAGGYTSLLINASGDVAMAARDPATGLLTDLVAEVLGPNVRGLARRGSDLYLVVPGAGGPSELFHGRIDVPGGRVVLVDADADPARVDGVPLAEGVFMPTVDPSGNWVVAPGAGGTIDVLRIAADGALTGLPVVTVPLGTTYHAVFSRSGRTLFLTSTDRAGLLAFGFDPASGALTPTASLPARRPLRPVAHPTLDVLYVPELAPGSIGVLSYDDARGTLTRTATVGLDAVFGLAVSADGRSLYAGADPDGVTQYTIDAATGALTRGDSSAIPGGSQNGNYHFAFSPGDAQLYVNTYRSITTFAVTPGTGALTERGQIPLGNLGGPLVIVP